MVGSEGTPGTFGTTLTWGGSVFLPTGGAAVGLTAGAREDEEVGATRVAGGVGEEVCWE